MESIFITYSSFEKDFVKRFKETLKETFNCEVFDFKGDLGPGDDWFDEIRKELEQAALHIIILSPVSIKRPWTYFEAGGTWIKKTEPILMRLGLSGDKIPASNPLSRLWHGDLFKKEDVEGLFEKIKKYFGDRVNTNMNDFVKVVTDALGDEYHIVNAFQKIMEKDVEKEPNVRSLHAQGIAPVPVILYEAFGERCLEERLGMKVGMKVDNPNKSTIKSCNSAKLGHLVKCFKGLENQKFIKRIETPLEEFLKETIKKAEERANFWSEVPDVLFKNERVLSQIDFETGPLAGLKNYPFVDENDLIAFLQIEEILTKILGKNHECTGPSPERIWYSIIELTKEWWDEYKDYFFCSDQSKIKMFNLSSDSEGEIIGSFHTLLWETGLIHKELRDFLRSWYKILV